MDNKSVGLNEVAQNIVNAVVPPSFMKVNKCSKYIYKRVKARIFEDAVKLLKKKQYCADVILTQKQKVQAILHSEILLAEQSQKTLNSGLNINYSDTDNSEKEEDFASKLTESKKDSVITNNYFEYLSQYKKDIELFNRVKGLEMRGKKYKVSSDGSCPKCCYKRNIFVVLDFLFLSGDMPEILQYLLAKGKAILWSSKGTIDCKDPPTFLCSGRCPSDVSKSGFNINWEKTDLEKIYLFSDRNNESKEKPDSDIFQEKDKSDSSSELYMEDEEFLGEEACLNQQEYSDEEYDEGLVDINYYRNKVMWVVLDEFVEERDKLFVEEEAAIRTMLALEEARTDYIYGEMRIKSSNTEESKTSIELESSKDSKDIVTTTSSIADTETKLVPNLTSSLTNAGSAACDILRRDNKSKMTSIKTPTHILKLPSLYGEKENDNRPAFTAADFPVSNDGACPYCKATNVVYIIIQDDDPKEEELPPLLMRLLRDGNAKKVKRGDYDLPSFQCKQCTYGFNLDWSLASLETIFINVQKEDNTQFHKKTTMYEQQAASYFQHPYYASYPGYQQPYYISNQWMGYMPHNPQVALVNPYAFASPYYGYYSQVPISQDVFVGGLDNSNEISNDALKSFNCTLENPKSEKTEVTSSTPHGNPNETNEKITKSEADILLKVEEPTNEKASHEKEVYTNDPLLGGDDEVIENNASIKQVNMRQSGHLNEFEVNCLISNIEDIDTEKTKNLNPIQHDFVTADIKFDADENICSSDALIKLEFPMNSIGSKENTTNEYNKYHSCESKKEISLSEIDNSSSITSVFKDVSDKDGNQVLHLSSIDSEFKKHKCFLDSNLTPPKKSNLELLNICKSNASCKNLLMSTCDDLQDKLLCINKDSPINKTHLDSPSTVSTSILFENFDKSNIVSFNTHTDIINSDNPKCVNNIELYNEISEINAIEIQSCIKPKGKRGRKRGRGQKKT